MCLKSRMLHKSHLFTTFASSVKIPRVCLCVCRETVRMVNWRETSFSKSTQASFRKATPTSSASTYFGRSTRTTGEHFVAIVCDVILTAIQPGWLGSRVVSVLDSGAEGPGFKSQPRLCRVTVLGKLFTPIVPSGEIGSSFLKGCRVTAGLAESNGSLPPASWLTSPAGWLPRTMFSFGTLRSVIEYGLPLPLYCKKT